MISERKTEKALNKKVSWFFGPSLGGVVPPTPLLAMPAYIQYWTSFHTVLPRIKRHAGIEPAGPRSSYTRGQRNEDKENFETLNNDKE